MTTDPSVREFEAGSRHVDGPDSDAAIPPGHPSAPDTDLAPVEPIEGLDALRRDLAEQVKLPVITVPVDTRPGYSCRYRTDVSQADLDAWRKRAKDKRRIDGFAGERFACLILANTNTAIVRAGQEVTEDGEAMTFRAPELLTILAARGAAEAVAKFYGADAYVDQAARTVLRAGGWGDDVLEDDDEGPTRSGRG